ncbi:MAG: hypothetical protein LBJ23_07330 [Tannerella sp.]|jgi:hypothetical protein|nr:hypothetical protein [Tannerella sp.]
MKRLLMCLWFALCGVAVVHAQEIKINRPLENSVRMSIPEDYRQDAVMLEWEKQFRANILEAIAYETYFRSDSYEMGDEQSYALFNSRYVYPGVMMMHEAGGSMRFTRSNRFDLHMGAYAVKYNLFTGNTYLDAVFYLSTDYRLQPWLTVGVHGQHSMLSNRNAMKESMLPSPFVPVSGFGVHGTAMFNDVVGVQGAVGKEWDPYSGKWRTVYGIAPVINFNALFK